MRWLNRVGIGTPQNALEMARTLVEELFLQHIYFYNGFRDADDAFYRIRDPDVVLLFKQMLKWVKVREKKVDRKKYRNCFAGYDAILALVHLNGGHNTAAQQASLRDMMKEGLIQHPSQAVEFDPSHVYKVREMLDFEIHDDLVVITNRVLTEGRALIQDRKVSFLTTVKQCFVADDFVDWLQGHAHIENAPEVAQRMLRAHFIEGLRSTTDKTFTRGHDAYYRFNHANAKSHGSLTCQRILELRAQRARDFAPTAAGSTHGNTLDDGGVSPYAAIPPPRKSSHPLNSK